MARCCDVLPSLTSDQASFPSSLLHPGHVNPSIDRYLARISSAGAGNGMNG